MDVHRGLTCKACISKMAGIFGSLAECGVAPRVPVDLTASFRGSKVCRLHTSPVSPRPDRVCPFMTAAIAAGVKLPPTHVEASARALEQLRQTQNVNSAFLTNQVLECFSTGDLMGTSWAIPGKSWNGGIHAHAVFNEDK